MDIIRNSSTVVAYNAYPGYIVEQQPFCILSAGLTLFSALSAAIYGIIIVAIGETILVLIDIEQNTRGGSRVSATTYSSPDAALSGESNYPTAT